jgi:hypothetical protein
LITRQYLILHWYSPKLSAFSISPQVGFGAFGYLGTYSPGNIQALVFNRNLVCVFPSPNEGSIQLQGYIPIDRPLDPRHFLHVSTSQNIIPCFYSIVNPWG